MHAIDSLSYWRQFRHLDPTHFRNMLFNVLIYVTRPDGSTTRCFAEIQVQHQMILEYNDSAHAHDHYDFFRSYLKSYAEDLDANLDFMLEKRMRLFAEISQTPVKLSMLIVVMSAQSTSDDIGFPEVHFPCTLS